MRASLGRCIVPLCRELSEGSYLWSEAHQIDGMRLATAIGAVPHTPPDVAIARALEDLGTTGRVRQVE
jgi:hypothetical protein